MANLSPTLLQSRSIALECDCVRQHNSPTLIDTPLATLTQFSTTNVHCPLCGEHPKTVASTDAFHIRAMMGDLPYAAVKAGLNVLADFFGSHPNARNQAPTRHGQQAGWHIPNPNTDRIAFEDYLIHSQSTVCQLDSQCTTCGAVFTVSRNLGQTHTDYPQTCDVHHCPFCGSISIDELDSTPILIDALVSLSDVYSMPVPAIESLYEIWQSDAFFNPNHTFASFLNAFAEKATVEVSAKR